MNSLGFGGGEPQGGGRVQGEGGIGGHPFSDLPKYQFLFFFHFFYFLPGSFLSSLLYLGFNVETSA